MRSRAFPLGASLIAACLCLMFIATSALAERGHVFGYSFSEPGTGNGQLSEPEGVAVNEATGDVYVVDKGNNRVEYFSPAGTYLGQFNGAEAPTGQFSGPTSIAVDNSCHRKKLTGSSCAAADPSNEAIYVVDAGHMIVDKFDAAGAYESQIVGEPPGRFGHILSVTVATSGELWVSGTMINIYQGTGVSVEVFEPRGVDNYSDATENVFISSRSAYGLGTNGGGEPGPGLAVDSHGDFYTQLYEFTGPSFIVEFDNSGGASGRVNKNVAEGTMPVVGPGILPATEFPSDGVYVLNLSVVERFSSNGTLMERFGSSEALTSGSGIAVDSSTGLVYVADATGRVDVFTLEPPGVPVVAGDVVSNVAATSATFEAEVDPRSEPFEPVTSYRFEYGACASIASCPASYEHSVPVPDGLLAPNYTVDTVSAHVQGLAPHTAYHFRVVAHNSHPGSAEGADRTFTTQPTGSFALPDARLWELVSPPDKRGASLVSIGESGVIQASGAGDAFTYLATAPTEAQPPGNANYTQVFSERGPDGWVSRDIEAPHEAASGATTGFGQEYRFFSSDLAQGILQPVGAFVPSLSSEATEQTAYLRTNVAGGHACSEGCYRPLATEFNTLPGVPFGEGCLQLGVCGPRFLGGTSDLSHVLLWSASAPLTEGASRSNGLYEWSGGWSGGELVFVGEIDGGKPANFSRHAISTEGSRVIFSGSSEGLSGLLLRDTATSETVKLDALQGGSGAGPADPLFQSASSDGARVFFTDSQRLTSDAGGGEAGGSGVPDLYECEVVETGSRLGCRLTDLTPLIAGGESADVRGTVVGTSEDGSSVFFVADGVLTGAQETAHHERAISGQPNLYEWREGTTTLVAVLTADDSPDWQGGGRANQSTARASSDGRRLVFMSNARLTPYDNQDASSGRPDEEVYMYASQSLACLSCNPTGSRPHGVEYSHLTSSNDGLVGGDRVWNFATWIAASVPGWTPLSSTEALYQSRYLSDSGRVFFDSSDALVPQDTNKTEDVYEYESPGVGDCSTASPDWGEASGGCVDLISSGTSTGESAFLDASESGDDVFFLTSAQLSKRDTDSSLDVYDAHVDGGEAEPSHPVECQGDACQSSVSAPEDPTPGSLTFQGPGNIAPLMVAPAKKQVVKKAVKCKRGKKLTRGKCVKPKSKKKSRARKSASANRRAPR